MGDAAIVWWNYVLLFGAMGIYLIEYSKRCAKRLENFAKSQKLRIQPERTQALQRTLDSCFSSMAGNNAVRQFDQISVPIDCEGVWIFKTVELLDLNPHA